MNDQVQVLIVEDETIVAMGLEDTLQSEGYGISGIVDEGKKALHILEKEPVDIILLDIQIRGEWDGIETARRIMSLRELPFIFITAFTDRNTIERAKETRPAAYLTKPYQPQNLLVSIEIALNNFACRKNSPSKIVPLKTAPKGALQSPGQEILHFDEAFFIKQNNAFVKITRGDILYLESEGNYTCINTDRKKYLVRDNMQSILGKLNHPDFIRVHRSYSINIKHLDTFNDYTVFVGANEIPLGRNYKQHFFDHFNFL